MAGMAGQSRPGWRKLVASVAALAAPARQRSSARKAHRSERSICVLPFANM